MSLILTTNVNGLKYYVQLYNDRYILNGLEDNAIRFKDEQELREQWQRVKFDIPKHDLDVKTIKQ